MKLIRFISTGAPVTVKAVGQTFTVSDGDPHEVTLSKIDRYSIDVTVRPAESDMCPLEPDACPRSGFTTVPGLPDVEPTVTPPDRWRQISDIDRGLIADELHLKAVARYATGGQRRGDLYAEDPLDEAEEENIDGAFYIALARRERTEHRAKLAAAETEIAFLKRQLVFALDPIAVSDASIKAATDD